MAKRGAQPDNQNGTKLKDSKIRQEAYEDYCNYLATGKSKRGWVFQKDGHTCTDETMEKYIKDELEFDPLKKKAAEAKGFKIWEKVVEDSADGKNTKANTASLQMLMRNKFGWDRKQEVHIHEHKAKLDSFYDEWEEAREDLRQTDSHDKEG